MKKQELIKNIKSLAREASQQWPHEEMVELPGVLELVDQLDEPEVLSSEWISKFTSPVDDETPPQVKTNTAKLLLDYAGHKPVDKQETKLSGGLGVNEQSEIIGKYLKGGKGE